MASRLSNKEIEDLAVTRIMKKFRIATDERSEKNGYDMRIGNKIIEVKGTASSKTPMQRLCLSSKKEKDNIKKKNYWIYRVVNVGKKDCRLIKIPGSDITLKHEARWRIRVNHPKRYKVQRI
ncbi:MAG: DUF3883 domain-containing protein [Candidatus Micrarchaeota archaeon]|nr:DUF3883 domain-containing protein [Candidatus Micrarchaeota archaeon]